MECLLATNWRNVVARFKFLDAGLYNVNDATHSMVISIRFGCLQTEVSINLEVNWLCLCDFFTCFLMKAKQDKMKCLF